MDVKLALETSTVGMTEDVNSVDDAVSTDRVVDGSAALEETLEYALDVDSTGMRLDSTTLDEGEEHLRS